ncbi:family 18 putative glycoside hydrolase [Triangularia verruculosa]|uniref:chitinase n=1 Tax=Triangularia verruculosa TaxID=2587418 RepID=A0AAN7ARP6_9PEZI|nr:family 18 putative glycoside hydrolase [Triangularia verruculosa]
MKTYLYALAASGAAGAARAAGGFGFADTASSSSNSFVDITNADDDLDKWLSAVQAQPLEALKPCPISCSKAGEDPWYLFPEADQLASCNETMLLNLVVQMAEVKDIPTVIRACTADYDTSRSMRVAFVPDSTKASLCTTANKVLEDVSISMHQPGKDGEFSANHLLSAGRQVKSYLASRKPSCSNNAISFGYSQTSVIGLFAGAEVHQHGVTSDVLQKFLEHVENKSVSGTTVVQLCGAKDRGADYNIGLVASSAKNLDFVQEMVKTWADGECVPEAGAGEDWLTVTLRVPAPVEHIVKNGTISNSTASSQASTSGDISPRFARLSPRADCRITTVQAGEGCWAVADRCGISQTQLQNFNRANLCNSLVLGERVCCSTGTLPSTLPPGNSDGTCKTRQVVLGDDCGSLANKCGITGDDFTKANPQTGLCAKLTEGQHVCCSQGNLPDLRPKKGADGYCAVYQTKKDDNCARIAASHMLSVTQLENFNKNTWGWNGCNLLYPDFNMCVSDGAAPMPAIVPNAMCGPTMNSTVRPPLGTNISTMNPCPLNVCCNIWGQCGMTDDFCVVSKSETGAPGTAAPGQHGCISNCGRDIIKGSAPAKHMRLGYFEGWNFNRKCLNMDVTQIDTSAYTHIHFAFPNVTRGDFRIEITDPLVKKQFERFKKLQGVKKIVSLGGWDFSALPETFMILREAAQPANRATFQRNIISFINEHNLDGIDLDWEYPGAPDIPDIPSDDPINGLNYYRLLASIKAEVGSSKTVSFAAPASFWYLRAFPIKQMADNLDYIVFMTYDLHGQWDAGNKWTSPGCPTGNCLRSHVNETETRDALSMITKAGASSNKVLVGVSSYGRSFKMAEVGCDGESCLFTGDNRNSQAAKGRCTDTSGYISNAEIDQIIAQGRANKRYTKEGSNIMVYDNREWVAWMDNEIKTKRTEFYHSYNFLGTTDWAVDLQEWYPDAGLDEDDVEVVYLGPEVYSERTAYCTPPCRFVLPPSSLPSPTTISIPPYTTSIEVGRSQGGSFVTTTTTITVFPPKITTDQMPMSNVNITAAIPTDGGGGGGGIPPFYAIPSIDVPPIPVVVTPPGGGAAPTSRWITLPPWPKFTNGPTPNEPDADEDLPEDPGEIITDPFPAPRPPKVWDCPPGGVLELDDYHAVLTLDNCQGQVTLGGCAPTRTKAMDAPPDSTLLIGCTLFTGTQAPDPRPFPTGSSSLLPITTPVPDPPKEDDPQDSDSDDDDPEGVYLSCKAWFFFICIDWPELKVFGWIFPPLPPGPYRGGPPNIDWPKLPGITVKGRLPKWPTITIPTRGPIPTPEKPSNCRTQTAELCKMTTSYAGIVEGGTTRTTSSTTKETCATIYGCEVDDDASSTATFEGCTVTPVAKRELVPLPTPVQGVAGILEERAQPPRIQARAKKSPCKRGDAVIIPGDPENVQAIRGWLANPNNNPAGTPWPYTEIKSDRAGFTAFFHIVDIDRASLDSLSRERNTYGVSWSSFDPSAFMGVTATDVVLDR